MKGKEGGRREGGMDEGSGIGELGEKGGKDTPMYDNDTFDLYPD